MKKILALILSLIVVFQLGVYSASAQGVIPTGPAVNATGDGNGCENFTKDNNEAYNNVTQFKIIYAKGGDDRGNLLGCAIKTGKLHLYMMPYFITYMIQFLLGIAGLIAILFIVYGGFQYITGGLTEDKESGKKTIMYAVLGLIIALSAWIIVNFIQATLTA